MLALIQTLTHTHILTHTHTYAQSNIHTYTHTHRGLIVAGDFEAAKRLTVHTTRGGGNAVIGTAASDVFLVGRPSLAPHQHIYPQPVHSKLVH